MVVKMNKKPTIREKLEKMNLVAGTPIEIRYWHYSSSVHYELKAEKVHKTRIGYYTEIDDEHNGIIFSPDKEYAVRGQDRHFIAFDSNAEGITEVNTLEDRL